MNGIENTNTAAVAVEATPVAPKATKTAAAPLARKSLMGKWQKVGAPPKEILGLTKNAARGAFTKHDIFERNGRTISLLTIDKRIKALIKAKKLVRMAEALKSEGPGRPAMRYNFDLTKGAVKKTRTRKATVAAEPVALTETPAVEPAPAVVETPAPTVETPVTPAVETPAAA